jgi:hypothetical protein
MQQDPSIGISTPPFRFSKSAFRVVSARQSAAACCGAISRATVAAVTGRPYIMVGMGDDFYLRKRKIMTRCLIVLHLLSTYVILSFGHLGSR